MKDSPSPSPPNSRVDELRRQLTNSPSDAGIYNSIGDAYLADKQPDQAADAYMHAAAFYTRDGGSLKAIALYKKILKFDPQRPDIYTLIGDLNSERGLVNNAIGDYLSGAKLFLKDGNTKQALNLYRKITKVNPTNTSVRLRVAELCLKEGETQEAIEEYLLVADEYEGLGKNDGAREICEKIVEVAPSHPEARRRLGLAPLEREEVAISEGDALVGSPEFSLPVDVPTDEPQAPELSGTIEFNLDGLESQVAAETPPDLPATQPASLDEARECLASGDIERAERVVRTLLLEDPERREYQSLLGLVYLHKGDSSTAFEILYPIAQGWEEEGRQEAALGAANAFLAIEPDQSDFLDLRARISGSSVTQSALPVESIIPVAAEQAVVESEPEPPLNEDISSSVESIITDSPPVSTEALVETPTPLVELQTEQSAISFPETTVAEAFTADIEPTAETAESSPSMGLPVEEADSPSLEPAVEDFPAGTELTRGSPEPPATTEWRTEEPDGPSEVEDRETLASVSTEQLAVGTPPMASDEAPSCLITPVPTEPTESFVDTTGYATDMEEESSAIEVTVSDEQAIEMGSSQSIDGEFEAILQEFREGITKQLGDEDYETHYDLGIAYKEMGLFDEAIEEFQKAARGTARFVDSCTMIAACYKGRNLNKSAIACLEHALEDPRCGEATAPYLQYDLAALYEEENSVDKAMGLYARIPTIRDASERLAKLQAGASLSQ